MSALRSEDKHMSHVVDIGTADVGEQLRKRGCTTARFTDRQFCKLKVLSALRSEDKYTSHVDTADVGEQLKTRGWTIARFINSQIGFKALG